MKNSWNLSHAGLALVMVPLLFQVVFFSVLLNLLNQAEAERQQEMHAKKVLTLVTNASRALNSITANAVYCNVVNPDTRSEAQRKQFRIESRRTLAEMRKVETQGAEEKKLILRTASLFEQVFLKIESAIGSTYDEMFHLMPEARRLHQQFDRAVNELVDFEYQSQTKAKARHTATSVLYFGLAFNIFLAIVLANFFAKFVGRRLARISDNSERLASGEPLREPLSGTDEIARLDHSFHRMADALNEAALRKQEAEQLKQQFFNMISHDIRSPLTSLMASLSFITQGRIKDVPAEAIDVIRGAEESSNRLLNLTNDLLDLEKTAAKERLPLNLEDVSVKTILDDSYADVKQLAESRGIKVQIPDSDEKVFADKKRLTQVMINLLANAIKFSRNDSKIVVDIVINGNDLEVRVEDEGSGISAQDIERLFEQFQQADSAKRSGSGLGLAICRMIVEAHGGAIGVESEQGKGSVFWFSIPKPAPVFD